MRYNLIFMIFNIKLLSIYLLMIRYGLSLKTKGAQFGQPALNKFHKLC